MPVLACLLDGVVGACPGPFSAGLLGTVLLWALNRVRIFCVQCFRGKWKR